MRWLRRHSPPATGGMVTKPNMGAIPMATISRCIGKYLSQEVTDMAKVVGFLLILAWVVGKADRKIDNARIYKWFDSWDKKRK